MTSESPDTERELPDVAPQRIAGPVLFSVVLHGAVLLLFAPTVFSPPTEESPTEERPYVRVAHAMRPPLIEPEPPAPQIAVSVPSERVEVPEAEPTEPEALAVANAAPAEPPAPREEEIPEGASAAATIQPWTPARIRAAVQTSSGELRSTLTQEWMEECILEQKERNTRDCEQQLQEQDYLSPNVAAGRAAGTGAFASLTRPDQQWLLEEQFKKDNDTLRALIDEKGIVGALASARYYLNREYIVYVSGNRGDLVFAPMQNFAADVLERYRGKGLSLNGNIPVTCHSKKNEIGYKVEGGRASFGNEVPCIYEFTGFNIVRPEPEPDPNAFRVVPTVFGDRR